ncbi:MAG: peptidase M16 family protein [Vulcanimicrobiaceae bacterium]
MKRAFISLTALALVATPWFGMPQAYAAPTAPAQLRGSLPHGGSYVIRADPTLRAAAIELWFRAPASGYRNRTPGLGQLAAVSAAAAKLVSGISLVNLVRSVGGRLSVNVYPDIIGVGAVVPSGAARRVVAAMTAAYFAPRIDESALEMAKRDAAVLVVESHFSSARLLHDALFARIFAHGPAHYPALPGSVTSFATLALTPVQTYARRAFRSGNDLLVLTGNVSPAVLSAVTDGRPGRADVPIDSPLARSPRSGDVDGTGTGIGLAWVGPSIRNQRAATAMDFIADYLFRDGTGTVQRSLTNDDVSLEGQFITLHHPGVMLVTLSGPASNLARRRISSALAALRKPLPEAAFEAAKTAFVYHVQSDTQTLRDLADNLGWYAVEGNPSYAPGDASRTYLRTAAHLDPAFVAGVVRRYLSKPVTVRIISPKKGTAS